MLFEFFLPHVDFGRGKLPTKWKSVTGQESWIIDKLEFTIADRVWVLRKLVKRKDSLCPVDVAAALAFKAQEQFMLPHLESACILQTPETGWKLHEANEVADDICWMLHIALGQRVTWTEVGLREGETYTLQNARAVNAPESANRGGPIRDTGEHEIRNFLEGFYPVYRANVDWWRVTAEWFAIARESNIVQVVGLIASMLLDRVTLFCLKKHKFPKQIDETLKTDITEGSQSRKALEKQIDDFMKAAISDSWNKSGALVGKIREWNDQPPYETKVATVFEKFGLAAPSELALKNRNALAHNGELSSKTTDIGAYCEEIIGITTSLLLKMAKYQGPYFVPGSGVRQM